MLKICKQLRSVWKHESDSVFAKKIPAIPLNDMFDITDKAADKIEKLHNELKMTKSVMEFGTQGMLDAAFKIQTLHNNNIKLRNIVSQIASWGELDGDAPNRMHWNELVSEARKAVGN